MKLIPRVAGYDITPGSIKIYADKSGLEAANQAVAKAIEVTQLVMSDEVPLVVAQAQALHKILGEIETSRKAAKRDFLDGNKAIDALAQKIRTPIQAQYERLTGLLARWHDAETRRKEAEERKKKEEEDALAAKLRAESEERERQRQALLAAQANATTREELEQASMDLEFLDVEIPVDVGDQLEAIEIPTTGYPKGPIEGARVQTRYKFTLTDPVAAYQYDHKLVNWTLSILTCQDIVRILKDKNLEIKIPGIKIETYTDVTTPGRPNGC